jgi:glutaminyl-tRNA synthetase
VIKDADGNVIQLNCSYFSESKSGADNSGLKVKGTLHWVDAKNCIKIQVNEYDRLFKVEDPSSEEGDFKDYINPDSLRIDENALAEPALAQAATEERFQFLRKGYFTLDADSNSEKLIFNKTVGLKDSWGK